VRDGRVPQRAGRRLRYCRDPLWADFRDLALAHGLRACWSDADPVVGRQGVGTFAIYYREPRTPTPYEQNVIEQITHLASIAIEREQSEAALRQAQADLATSAV